MLLFSLYTLFTLYVYWSGQVPVIQGRFLLPVMPAFAMLLVLGLRSMPRGVVLSVLLVALLIAMDGLSLFTHVLPQYYPAASPQTTSTGAADLYALASLSERFGRFKPATVQGLLHATILGYIGAQAMAFLAAVRLAILAIPEPRISSGAQSERN
jgi:hypothetical protein